MIMWHQVKIMAHCGGLGFKENKIVKGAENARDQGWGKHEIKVEMSFFFFFFFKKKGRRKRSKRGKF